MYKAHGFFIIELLITITLVTWFMSMVLQHSVGCIKEQGIASSCLEAMNVALNILEQSQRNHLKNSTVYHGDFKIMIGVSSLPPFFISGNPPTLNTSCLNSLSIAHITGIKRSTSTPAWSIASVIART